MFEDLGLEPGLEDLYRLVLTRQSWGVQHLAQELGVGELMVQTRLDCLAEAQLLLLEREEAVVRAIRPSIALAALIARREAGLLREQHGLERARQAIAGLVQADYEVSNVCEAERLHGADQIRLRLDHLARSCKHRALIMLPGGGQPDESLAACRALDEEALERGVRVMTLFQESVRNHRPTLEYARRLERLGAQCRVVPTLPMRLLVLDDEIAVVPDEDAAEPVAYVIAGRALAAGLVNLFHHVWSQGTPIQVGAADSASSSQPAPMERAVLELLAKGYTDEVVATRLAVSLRTVRRVTAGLLDRLGARSRFQAGLLAAQAGWLR